MMCDHPVRKKLQNIIHNSGSRQSDAKTLKICDKCNLITKETAEK